MLAGPIKTLRSEYATFRDKTLPGSEEKWKIKISGYKKKKLQRKCWQVCMMHRLTSFILINGWSRRYGLIIVIVNAGTAHRTFQSLNQIKNM